MEKTAVSRSYQVWKETSADLCGWCRKNQSGTCKASWPVCIGMAGLRAAKGRVLPEHALRQKGIGTNPENNSFITFFCYNFQFHKTIFVLTTMGSRLWFDVSGQLWCWWPLETIQPRVTTLNALVLRWPLGRWTNCNWNNDVLTAPPTRRRFKVSGESLGALLHVVSYFIQACNLPSFIDLVPRFLQNFGCHRWLAQYPGQAAAYILQCRNRKRKRWKWSDKKPSCNWNRKIENILKVLYVLKSWRVLHSGFGSPLSDLCLQGWSSSHRSLVQVCVSCK